MIEEGSSEPETVSRSAGTARLLGFAGLAPFIALSLWLYGIAPDHEWRAGTILLLLAYGAVVLSFLGGARWGIALSGQDHDARLDFSLAMLPPLIGWIAIFIPVPYAFAVLAVAFSAQGAWDTLAVHAEKAPGWYGELRTILTIIVVLTMIVAFIATS